MSEQTSTTVAGDAANTAAKPIVVGFDGSESARQALAWAARQGALTGAPVELLSTWSMPKNYGYAIAFETNLDLEGDTKKALDEAVAGLEGEFPDVDFRTHVVEGEPRNALVARSKSAQMLVVGSRGHGELTGMLLGSVSGYCVTHAACPVLVMHG